MLVAFTGHRPSKLGTDTHSGYIDNPLRAWIRDELRKILRVLRPLYGISGMALGVDQIAAEVCLDLGIPFIAAVPFKGQEHVWHADAQKKYHELLSKAHEVIVVSEGVYERWKLIARNQFMVDHSNKLIAVWDGSEGGTSSTIEYALHTGRIHDIVRVNPNDYRDLVGAAS